jgi:hypothetical protein
MIHYLIAQLEADTAITDLVGNNIFPLSRLQNSNTPCIVLQMTGSQENEQKGFHLNIITCFVEVTVIAETPAATWRLATKVFRTLNGNTDDNILSNQFNQWVSDVFEADELFTITLNFTTQIKL